MSGNQEIYVHQIAYLLLQHIILIIYVTNIVKVVQQMEMDVKNLILFFVIRRQLILLLILSAKQSINIVSVMDSAAFPLRILDAKILFL